VEQGADDEKVANAPRVRPLDAPAAVRSLLPPDAEVVEVPNDPGLWELASWPALWGRVLDGADDADAVLYCHAKGATRRPGSPCHRWAEVMWELALDHWDQTEALLRRFPIAGSMKRTDYQFQPPLDSCEWFYSGNFWWARTGVLRQRLASVPRPADRWTSEAWVGMAYRFREGGELFGPSSRTLHYYNPDDIDRLVADHAAWLLRHPPGAPSRKPAGVRLSIILPTSGRETLGRTLASVTPQLAPGDELILLRDASGDWGHTPRQEAMGRAKGDYLLFMDDDDIYTEGALDAVRAALAENPGRPHVFRMRRVGPANDVLPAERVVRLGNVSTQMMVVPNDTARLGAWGRRYEGDFDFLASTLAKYPPDSLVWRDEVITVWRHGL
jgi:hypothetical protein